jgi:cbb3-type cytochrome oxidase subunit 3
LLKFLLSGIKSFNLVVFAIILVLYIYSLAYL